MTAQLLSAISESELCRLSALPSYCLVSTPCLAARSRNRGFHMLIHLPSMVLKHGALNCFVLERKHKNVKAWANRSANVHSGWAKNILHEVTARHLAHIARPDAFAVCGLCSRSERNIPAKMRQHILSQISVGGRPVPTTASLWRGRSSRPNLFDRVTVGDVVFYSTRAGLQACCNVISHFAIDLDGAETFHITMIEPMHFVKTDPNNKRVSIHKKSGQQVIVPTEAIQCVASCWSQKADDTVSVVRQTWHTPAFA